MKHFLPLPVLCVLMLGCQDSQKNTQGVRPSIQQNPRWVAKTVVENEPFDLAWKDADGKEKACIHIDSDKSTELDGTTIYMKLNSPVGEPGELLPEAFRAAARAGRTVYLPIFLIQADRDLPSELARDFFTIGICAHYPVGGEKEFYEAGLAHTVRGTLEYLEEAAPCELRCDLGNVPYTQQEGSIGRVFRGTPLNPSPLFASPEERGVGGKGGTLSPFGVVERP